MSTPRLFPTLVRAALSLVLTLGLVLAIATPLALSAAASPLQAAPPDAPFPFDDADCGPPSTTIPGPPPNLIVVGQPMSDSWLMCYLRQDLEGQTFSFDHWGEIRKTPFRGYPVECWTPEAAPDAAVR